MSHDRLLIYGAYGYTGELIARQAVADGRSPVLSGRNAAKVAALAQELGLDARPFDLGGDTIAGQLADIDVVLHCAGPFVETAPAMVEACIATGTHYLDITGEIDVFEHVFARDADARETSAVLCPGAGFDVVPTDCLAAALAAALPDATTLALGFDSRSGLSPGTAKTSVDGLAGGGRVRRNGRIVKVPLAADVREIDFGNGLKPAMTIPWGDVATAYYSTRIPNVAVYMPMSSARIRQVKWLNWVRPVFALSPVKNFLKARAGQVRGPDTATRARHGTYVWGEVRNAAGDIRVGRVHVANGYDVTIHASLALAQRLLTDAPAGGAYTPSKLAGAAFVETLPGSGTIQITDA
ncbi:saccharopine dehydrogenase family protein [Salinisphaera hydrothermalis]|uniref:Saccharopine dehydrogenase n=1 Tax=Salinisphaera hydrothermalis (strain C41B8) TaxID=1304275 RepID=A0A084IM10_SALHC|nr:saccharopine dehydrogenase NADP-binding domain-containing protein [Salinisphaera hydrothermalis]KEZ77744.1 saccharopine dehydrogenase [Salinisphaera hydrothermalis C41B8]